MTAPVFLLRATSVASFPPGVATSTSPSINGDSAYAHVPGMPPNDADLRPVETREDAVAYWQVCDFSYPSLGMPEGALGSAFTPESQLDADRVAACLALADGKPAACASLYEADGVGMVGWVAAIPEARGRGLAAACTVWATNTGFERGAAIVSLQASHMGEDIYRRLGYEELFSYRLYGAMPS